MRADRYSPLLLAVLVPHSIHGAYSVVLMLHHQSLPVGFSILCGCHHGVKPIGKVADVDVVLIGCCFQVKLCIAEHVYEGNALNFIL